MVVDDAVVVRGLRLALDRRGGGPQGRGLAAHRPPGGRPARAHRSRRRHPRRRDAGARWHRRAAAAAREEARPRRDHGVDAHPPQRGDQPEGARRSAPPTTSPSPRATARSRPRPRSAATSSRRSASSAGRRQRNAEPVRARSCGRSACFVRLTDSMSRDLEPARIAAPCDQTASVLVRRSARAADRVVDRRPAGAPDRPVRSRRRAGAHSRAGHPAYAADLHHHPRRASRPRDRAAVARRHATASRSSAGTSTWRRARRHMRVRAQGRAGDRDRRRAAESISAGLRSIRCSRPLPRSGAPLSCR